MTTTDSNALAQNAKCLSCGIPPGMQGPVLIWIFAQIAGVSTDPNFLVAQAQCINCGIPPGMQMAVLIWIASQFSGGGGGGTGGNPAPGVVNPNGNVSAAPGATYFNTANSTFWVQASAVTANTGWVQLI